MQGDVYLRRICVLAGSSGEGLLTDPIATACPGLFSWARNSRRNLATASSERLRAARLEASSGFSLARWSEALLALSGTLNPYPGKLGVVEPDAHADLLVVAGDPLQDISLLARPTRTSSSS
jgi:hypothetical protein